MAVPPIVDLQDVTKRFGDGPLVLDRVRLAAAPGDFVSLIGPSGCGKSTLLRLIAGLSPVTGGTLRVDGRTPDQAAAELAFVFQEPTLLPWLTVSRNVELALKLRGVPADARTATRRQVLDLVRLGDRADAYPRQLSGGQKMRVSIARALSLSPKILLLDEPFGALDEMTRERMNNELLRIWTTIPGMTVIFVTHNISEAVYLSTRVVVMSPRPGRVSELIDVDLPQPRGPETLELEPFFHAASKVRRALHEGVAG